MAILSWAAYDFVVAVRHKDEQLQHAGLRSQLVDFLLATTREPDGSSLLDNPDDFALARRPLKVVSVQKPFFGYFLTKGNHRTFHTELVRPSPPRSCVLEYPLEIEELGKAFPRTVKVCIAAVPNDPSGRYLYAVIRYPTAPVTTHRRGQGLTGSDLIRLKFQSPRSSTTSLSLVLEAPNLPSAVKARNPGRFDGLYEVAAFLNDNAGRPSQWVSGQAIDRIEPAEGGRFVTLAIRIDAAAVFNHRTEGWPDAVTKNMSVSLEIRRVGAKPIVIDSSRKGTASFSLAQAYLTAVPSGAVLEIRDEQNPQQLYWTSKSLESPGLQAAPGLLQRFGDWIASLLKGETIRVLKSTQSQGLGPLAIELRSSGNVIPDFAARVLALLAIATVIVFCLAALHFYAAGMVGKVVAEAMSLAKRRHGEPVNKIRYGRDQMGTIGRVMYFLDRRVRAEVATKLKSLAREAEVVEQHKRSLGLIAHEIRSPVATLLELNPDEGENRRLLKRMERAIAIFKHMEEVEALKQQANMSHHDLAHSLADYAANYPVDQFRLVYVGLQSGVFVYYDDILLDQVLQNIFENAERFAEPGTDVVLRLDDLPDQRVFVEIFNQGPSAPDTEQIFQCGMTTSEFPGNFGFGLYAARRYVSLFGGTIRAENRPGGFAIVLEFPRA